MNQFVEYLLKFGDVVEKRGIEECGLGEKFPRYAEFWTMYILPKRDPTNYSKLQEGVPVEFEDLFNNHYGVFFQLTLAYYQLKHLRESPVLDIATPLYHLGTATDLIIRSLFLALQLRHIPLFVKLDKQEIVSIVEEFCEKEYEKGFRSFQNTLRPVQINLHEVIKTVSTHVPELRSHEAVFRAVREYRNALTHGLSPVRLRDEHKEIYLPTSKKLKKYTSARWSSGQWRPADFAPAVDIITELADKLTASANEIWEALLRWMKELQPSTEALWQFEVGPVIPHEYEESGGVWTTVGSKEPFFYSGGTVTPNSRLESNTFFPTDG
ncbi:MAG: hypothetical protein IPO91_09370 [Chloroflexi bacterium]|nr:hypothetical protein [Chloroflexota bacterium]